MKKGQALADYRLEVAEGIRPPPQRKKGGPLVRKMGQTLGRDFGKDRGKKLILTLHPDGRIEIRPERSRKSESIMVIDVYRYAIKCRVLMDGLRRMLDKRARKAERLAAQRQQRAERKMTT